MFFVEIKGKRYKVIRDADSILVYKKPRCKCGCEKRLPYRKTQKMNGVPDYINGHNSIGKHWFLSKENEEKYYVWMLEPTIIEDGIKKYENIICLCGCKGRIPYKESNKKNGIPDFIISHNSIGKYNSKKYNALLSEPIIIINKIKVYENWICHCEDECGLHIPYPITKSGLRNHIRKGIPNVIKGHITEETRQKLIEAQLEYYKKHPERAEKQSEIMTGKFGEDNNSWKGGQCVSWARTRSKRRKFGFEPFNYWFKDSEEHHLDHNFVIHIPSELHKYYRHSQKNIDSMKLINHIAFDFLGYQTKLKYYNGIKNDDDVTTLSINYVNIKYGKN